MKRIFTDEELTFIKDNYRDMTYQEITDELNKFNVIKKTSKQVRTKASVLGLSKKKYSTNVSYFNVIDSTEKAYWLGFMYADGYVAYHKMPQGNSSYEVSIELNSIDAEHINKFRNALNSNVPITTRVGKDRYIDNVLTKGGKLYSQIRIFSKKLYSGLVNNGVVKNKTYRKEYPVIADKYFYDFLRGYIDGDGTITDKGQVSFSNSNYDFCQYIASMLRDNGFDSNIYHEETWKYRLTINGKANEKFDFLKKLYADSNTNVRLDRKYQKAINFMRTVA